MEPLVRWHILGDVPDDILAAIDCFAANSGLSRTGFIENAAKKVMKFEHT
jgi:hypothetical protein